ncbi:hypothetical protein [Sulfobacillus thermosulfidooxidans]|uniref:hypothetical protein n=1 Tax=Sulfobacillus thermosulfidooxidans TaxID=28034 RepID=UPI0006B51BC1|nr:hypothetical protein [Sulfobacillus thermosulfidooxidans]
MMALSDMEITQYEGGNFGDVVIGLGGILVGTVGLMTAPELAPAWLTMYRVGAGMVIAGGVMSTVGGFLT